MGFKSQIPKSDNPGQIDPDALLDELASFPIQELPGASGLWAVSSDVIHAAYKKHWGRLSYLCNQLFRVSRSHDHRFPPLRGRIAGLMTALSAFSWQEADGPEWNDRAESVIARFVPSLHNALRGAPLSDETIDSMSLEELMAGVRVARNARRGFVPHLMALSDGQMISRIKRSNEARLELRLAEHFYRRADSERAACAHDFLWMARFDLFRALGEERLIAPAEMIRPLSREVEGLFEQLTYKPAQAPDRYRVRTLGFSSLFDNAIRTTPRSAAVISELLLEEVWSSASAVSRQSLIICEFNALVARNERNLTDIIDRLESQPGVVLREKSLFNAESATKLCSTLGGRMHGLNLHLSRELELVSRHNLRKVDSIISKTITHIIEPSKNKTPQLGKPDLQKDQVASATFFLALRYSIARYLSVQQQERFESTMEDASRRSNILESVAKEISKGLPEHERASFYWRGSSGPRAQNRRARGETLGGHLYVNGHLLDHLLFETNPDEIKERLECVYRIAVSNKLDEDAPVYLDAFAFICWYCGAIHDIASEALTRPDRQIRPSSCGSCSHPLVSNRAPYPEHFLECRRCKSLTVKPKPIFRYAVETRDKAPWRHELRELNTCPVADCGNKLSIFA